jgi:hypothetical protein
MQLPNDLPKIELPPAEELFDGRDSVKKKPRNTLTTGRASKICHRIGHEWRDPETGGLGPKCLRCGRIHPKRGKVNLG